MRRTPRAAAVLSIIAATLVGAGGVASAEPVDPSPINFWDRSDWSPTSILVPTDAEFWNPFIGKTRVISPFGRTTKIVCSAIGRGAIATECYQADPQGGVHRLTPVPSPSDALGSLAQHPASMYLYTS